MGFRNYSAGLNQFLSRDMYNGALADMQLVTDPFTGNRYTFGAGNPISNIELDGHMFPAGYGGGTGWNYSPAPAPVVSSPRLKKILDQIYARPGTKGPVWESGTVYDALLEEKATGRQIGGKWHALKASGIAKQLTELLKEDAESGGKVLSAADRQQALEEFYNLADALSAPDSGGGVTKWLNDNPARISGFKKNMEDVGTNIKVVTNDVAGGPGTSPKAPGDQSSESRPPTGPEEGGADLGSGDILGIAGWILLIIDAQRHGGIFSPGGCWVLVPDPSVCPSQPPPV